MIKEIVKTSNFLVHQRGITRQRLKQHHQRHIAQNTEAHQKEDLPLLRKSLLGEVLVKVESAAEPEQQTEEGDGEEDDGRGDDVGEHDREQGKWEEGDVGHEGAALAEEAKRAEGDDHLGQDAALAVAEERSLGLGALGVGDEGRADGSVEDLNVEDAENLNCARVEPQQVDSLVLAEDGRISIPVALEANQVHFQRQVGHRHQPQQRKPKRIRRTKDEEAECEGACLLAHHADRIDVAAHLHLEGNQDKLLEQVDRGAGQDTSKCS